MAELRLTRTVEPSPALIEKMTLSINEEVRQHWNDKIRKGIPPIEKKILGTFDLSEHEVEQANFGQFEADQLQPYLERNMGIASTTGAELHYFGVGTGKAFEKVVPIANSCNYSVVASDISDVGCENAENVFAHQKGRRAGCGIRNTVVQADITFACNKKFIRRNRARLIVASRVLDVLDKQEPGWNLKPPHERKMARTARGMGSHTPYLDVFLIHRCPEDNPDAVWGDSTPHTLEEVLAYMQEGTRVRLQLTRTATVMYHGQIHTAAWIRRKHTT